MEALIDKIKHADIIEIKRLLSNSTNIMSSNPVRDILDHISNGIALKLVKNGKIVGIWCSKDIGMYTSLSYFYIDESVRRTMVVLDFFITAGSMLDKSKPVLITTKDTTGFDRYVEKIGENLYKFKGLR